MDGDSGIDPRLRDSIQSSQPAQEYPPAATTGSNPVRLPPPTSQAPYQPLQSPQQPQGYPAWPHDAGYQPYYPQHVGSQPAPATSSTGQQPPSLPAGTGPSAPQYVSPRMGEIKRLRACEACRGLKVRCEPDPNGGPCQRCLKAGRHCMITAPSRKRQKKTDSRVAELEKRIDALTATLHTKDRESAPGGDAERYGEEDAMQYEMTSHQHGMRPGVLHQNQPYATAGAPPNQHTTGDKHHLEKKSNNIYDPLAPVINFYQTPDDPQPFRSSYPLMPHRVAALRDSIDTKLATSLFDRYTIDMVPQMPIVTFPPSSSVETLRKDKPCLFGVIMCVASADNVADLHRTLVGSVLQDVAAQVFDGQATFELVQSLLVLAVWHWRENQRPLSALYAQNAAAMAIIKGLNDYSSLDLETLDGLERGRAWLGCYFLLSTAQMGCQNTIVNIIDKGVKEFVELLRSSAIASQHDRHLGEMVSQQRHLQSIFSASDTSPQSIYQLLDSSPEKDDRNSFVTLSQLFSQLYALEAARNAEHQTPLNKPPSRGRGRVKADTNLPDNNKATEQALACASSILDRLNEFSAAQLRCLPSFRIPQLAHLYIFLLRHGLEQGPANADNVDKIIQLERHSSRLTSIVSACAMDAPPSVRITALLHFLAAVRVQHDIGLRALEKSSHSQQQQQQQHSGASDGQAPVDGAGNRALHLLSEVATGNRDASHASNESPNSSGGNNHAKSAPAPATEHHTDVTVADATTTTTTSEPASRSRGAPSNVGDQAIRSLLGLTQEGDGDGDSAGDGADGDGDGTFLTVSLKKGMIDDAAIELLLGLVSAGGGTAAAVTTVEAEWRQRVKKLTS